MSEDRWSLSGKVALVTGAGRGLGLGCAHALAEAGAAVLAVARTAEEVEQAAAAITAAGGTARAHVADVTDERQVAGAVARRRRAGRPARVRELRRHQPPGPGRATTRWRTGTRCST